MQPLIHRAAHRAPQNIIKASLSVAGGVVTRAGLRIHFWLYCRAMSRGLFPLDERIQKIEGPSPERLLFVGDVAVAGYGVLRNGMSAAAQTAAQISARTGRGVSWSSMSALDLTVRKVATLPCEGKYDIDRVIFMMGIPDVLLGTSTDQWTTSLRTVLNRARTAFSTDVQIVFAGIPPMGDFRPMPPVARLLLSQQVRRLNRAAARVLNEEDQDGTNVFVPSPDWHGRSALIESQFSWRDLHTQLGHAIAESAAFRLSAPGTSKSA